MTTTASRPLGLSDDITATTLGDSTPSWVEEVDADTHHLGETRYTVWRTVVGDLVRVEQFVVDRPGQARTISRTYLGVVNGSQSTEHPLHWENEIDAAEAQTLGQAFILAGELIRRGEREAIGMRTDGTDGVRTQATVRSRGEMRDYLWDLHARDRRVGIQRGDVIRVAREAQKLSIRGLARLSGVSRHKISQIELGYPDKEDADRKVLCEALGDNLARIYNSRDGGAA